MKAKFNFTISGLMIALVLVSMFASVFSTLMVEVNTQYNITGENSFEKYNITEDIKEETNRIRSNATEIEQQSGVLDIIGGYFTSGYAALKLSAKSIDLSLNMLNDAASDVEFFGVVDFGAYISMILLIAIFVGVIIAVLVKMRI